jgi:hypothetical protein
MSIYIYIPANKNLTSNEEQLKEQDDISKLIKTIERNKNNLETNYNAKLVSIQNEFYNHRLDDTLLKTMLEKELTDKVLIAFIFSALKKACFKIKSANGGMKKSSSKHLINGNNSNQSLNNSAKEYKNSEFEKNQMKNAELLINLFNVALSFLRIDFQEDISLSALNFIFKYLEEKLCISINGKSTTVKIYFRIINLLLKNMSYLPFI